MDSWERQRQDGHRRRHHHRRDHPSFSSTLLDAVYRSIDEGREIQLEIETNRASFHKQELISRSKKQSTEKIATTIRRKSTAETSRNSVTLNSAPTNSSRNFRNSNSVTLNSTPTNSSRNFRNSNSASTSESESSTRNDAVLKKKSRAAKIYGDLKKAKQPISPGGRLASFLNSIFAATSAKKAKIESSLDSDRREFSSNCSSASSFSRSCLSKNRESSSNCSSTKSAKRSVRFCPVSVIVDEDCRPCGHKNIDDDDGDGIKFRRVWEEKRRVREDRYSVNLYDQVDGDGDDDSSCASSDLFELDNLSAIEIERYNKELPVYETTTHFSTNRAITNNMHS